ncbi:rhodanese-like domain-containing protein [Bacillus alkalicellulosilyticus]|uniref:rhodanese-like domain-containing protein n=1 Tax=Alkalihalobacterium alkalicellulosilyticum TaxID=1912214 RepID=UPI000998D4AB|nr:rhodanese-like domain-containing protein [Bacillus alkalicellulosilyticus]
MEFIINLAIILLVTWFLFNRLVPTIGVVQINTVELKKKLSEKNVKFIDVRTRNEFNQFHIPSFMNVPLHELTKKANQLSKEVETVVICQSGMRSNKATKVLKKLGFQKISNVKGGISKWS